MKLFRGNVFAEIHGAPGSFRKALSRHLAVPCGKIERDDDTRAIKTGARFGEVFWHEGEPWGSLVRDGCRVPAGLANHVLALAQHYRIPCEYHDTRQRPEDRVPWWSVSMKWRPYQDTAHKSIIQHCTGVVGAPPRAGKTAIMARAIDTFAVPTLVIAPSVQIVEQTYNVFCRFFTEEMVARLDGSATPDQRDIEKPIVVATAASAVKQSDEWFATRLFLAIDEFHHAAADTYHQISDKCVNAYYRVGFTGTHFRTGVDALAMEAVCSQRIFSIGVSDLVEGGFLAPPRIVYAPTNAPRMSSTSGWDETYSDGISKNETRNRLVKKIAETVGLENNIPIIVLVKHRQHADHLGEIIKDSQVVKGGMNVLTSRTVKEFCDGRFNVLIGTTVIGEGVDVPRAGALVYASGGGASVIMMQSYFRCLTAHAGKSVGLVYDFVDNHHSTLASHSLARMEFARKHIGERFVVKL